MIVDTIRSTFGNCDLFVPSHNATQISDLSFLWLYDLENHNSLKLHIHIFIMNCILLSNMLSSMHCICILIFVLLCSTAWRQISLNANKTIEKKKN